MNFSIDKKNILITGTSRGLGDSLLNILSLRRNHYIFSISRKKISLKNNNIEKIYMDISNIDKFNYLKKILTHKPLDVVIYNAGVFYEDNFFEISVKNMLNMYLAHVISPLKMTAYLFENIIISKIKLIVIVTGRMGTFYHDTGGEFYGYRTSKTAQNNLVKILAYDLKKFGIKVLAIHPGWLKTKMGGKNAQIDVVDSAKGIINIIDNYNLYDTGKFYDYLGNELAW
jgi:short-subunit dehydrogenase